MTLLNVSNNILLSHYLPNVKCKGKTNLDTNLHLYPNTNQILTILWRQMDIGHIHCCKKINIQDFPNEIMDEIISYLYPHGVSVSYVISFWDSIFMDQFVSLRYYEQLKNNGYSETRLFIIEMYVHLLSKHKIENRYII